MCYSSTLLFEIYYLDSWSTIFAFKISIEVDSLRQGLKDKDTEKSYPFYYTTMIHATWTFIVIINHYFIFEY